MTNAQMTDLGFGVLTWRAPETLRQTLESHQAAQTERLAGERVVFVQEQDHDPHSVAIAREFGWRVAGSAENLGILGGIEALARSMRSPFILFNENDYQVIQTPDATAREIAAALRLIRDDRADIAWLRSRAQPGAPFTVREKSLRFFPGADAPVWTCAKAAALRLARPGKAKRMAARAIRFDDDAYLKFPNLITDLGDGWMETSSRWIPWTNNPSVLRRDLLMRLIDQANRKQSTRRANGFKNFEIELNAPWWRAQNFRIAQGRGVFTHNRIGYRGY